jgi:hypothetical protein
VADDSLPFFSRLVLAWLAFFRVLFDGRFAAHVGALRNAPALPPAPAPTPTPTPTPAPAPAPALAPAPAPTPTPTPAPAPAPAPAPTSTPPSTDAALQLLALLQREGRLVDFLQQDIASFPDADVGVAARVVHEGCRKALRSHAAIEPVRAEDEGARVKLEAGFDPDAVKLVGEVKGEPPYAGVLRHRGWRATKLELPRTVGDHDARVLAPAEVELS